MKQRHLNLNNNTGLNEKENLKKIELNFREIYINQNNNISPKSENSKTYRRIDAFKETSDLVDDDFNTNKIDENKWTITKGDLGVVDLLNTTLKGERSVYDMTTISDKLLVQTADSKDFEMYQDFTLADGESIILSMDSTVNMTQTAPNFLQAGFCLGDGATALTGNYFALKFSSNNDGWWILREVTGGLLAAAWGDEGDEPAIGARTIYYRVSRIGSDYQAFYSLDGENWMIGNYLTPIDGAPNRLFLFCKSSATREGSPLPITHFNWIRKGTNGIRPWNNTPTNPPIVLESTLGNDNGYVEIKMSETINYQTLIESNFSINYTQNGDLVTELTVESLKDSIGNILSQNVNSFRVYIGYSGDSNGLGDFNIQFSGVKDIYENEVVSEETKEISLITDISPIASEPSVIAYWEEGVGDNDSVAPYSKTDSINSRVLLSSGTTEPSLNSDVWNFNGFNQGFKNNDTGVLSPFSEVNRDCQVHYIASFPTNTGESIPTLFYNSVTNGVYKLFHRLNTTISFSAGGTAISNLITPTLNQFYLFSVKFYIVSGVRKMDLFINDGTTDVYSNLDVTASAGIAGLDGFGWALRERDSGATKVYSRANVKSCLIASSSNNFEGIRTELISQV